MKTLSQLINESKLSTLKIRKIVDSIISNNGWIDVKDKDDVNGEVISYKNGNFDIKYEVNLNDGMMEYTNTALFTFKKYEDEYHYTITTTSGTRGVSHTNGYGYSSMYNDQYVIKETELLNKLEKIIKNSLRGSFIYL